MNVKKMKNIFTMLMLIVFCWGSTPVYANETNSTESVIPFMGVGTSDSGTYEVQITGTITAALKEGQNILTSAQLSNIIGRGIMVDNSGTSANWNQNRITGATVTIYNGVPVRTVIHGNAKTANYKLDSFSITSNSVGIMDQLFALEGQSETGQYSVKIGGILPKELVEGTNTFGVEHLTGLHLWGVLYNNSNGENKILKQDAITSLDIIVDSGKISKIVVTGKGRTASGRNDNYILAFDSATKKTFYEWFPDTELARLVSISLETTPDQLVSQEELLAVQEIDVYKRAFNTHSITSLEGIEALKNLRILNVESNRIEALPESIAELEHLSNLNISNNNITSLPESFAHLPNLTTLRLYNTGLSSLPESFTSLPNLKHLYITSTLMTHLPESFGQLSQLTLLEIGLPQLVSLPDSFGDLPNLNVLFLEGNSLAQLPESFGNLSSLGFIALHGPEMIGLPESFGNLSSLNYLLISGVKLGELSESFGNLSNLENLHLDQTQLTSLPESFGNLSKLKDLSLGYNHLETLPESFYNLTGLKQLHLYGNPFINYEEIKQKIEEDFVNLEFFTI